MTEPGTSSSVYTTRTKIVIVVVLLLAAGGFTLAVRTMADPEESEVQVTGDADDQIGFGPDQVIVEEYLPGRGVESVAQQPVGLDLASGWAVERFTLNDVTVPVDQLEVGNELATYRFVPGEDKAVTEYQPGTNCASAVVYRLADGADGDPRTERWCFEVL